MDLATYLRALKLKTGDRKICILFDQLSVHRTHRVRNTLAECGYESVMNAAYYPMGNPIEYCFAQVKHYFKAERLKVIVTNQKKTVRAMIKDAFERVTKENCVNYIRKS